MLCIMTAVMGLNIYCDPFQLVRKSAVYLTDQQMQRLAYAGVIRSHSEYQAAIVGSSLTANFDPALFHTLYGEQAEILSMLNGRPREIEDVLRYVLKHQPGVRHIVVEWDVTSTCDREYPSNIAFPKDIYSDRVTGNLRYLISSDTLAKSLGLIGYRLGYDNRAFSPRMDLLTRTYENTKDRYGNPDILKGEDDRFYLKSREVLDTQSVEYQAHQFAACFRDNMLPIIQSHPNVEFQLVRWPPYQWAILNVDLRPALAAYSKYLELTHDLPNVSFYDFYADAKVVDNCLHYMDLFHFDASTSDHLLEALAKGEFKRNKESGAELDRGILAQQDKKVACPVSGS